ncbi:DNA helicase UvrD, partial [Candidatus Aerophobetes bacterium]|nr:DNA helicase UvrD [Candidatus Aerophobetes bacterium]
MSFIADFHVHSKYSRATSKDMDIPGMEKAARIKGIDLLGTGDFTHPLWRAHLKETLKYEKDGIFRYKEILFILTAEVSNVFYQNGKLRKIHNIIFVPHFDAAEKISSKLERWGDLYSDARPTLRLTARELVEVVMETCSDAMVVPSHVWTPWFSLFGSNSGFDSVEECFGNLTPFIPALETGLSSDPAMNWQVSSLDRFTLISNSDAHSPANLGREANVFSRPVNYYEIKRILEEKRKDIFLYTVEFFPQEGKYHWDGHRKCGVSFPPKKTEEKKGLCPVCGKSLTVGVLNRVYQLADREEGFVPPDAIPFRRIVPLREIIAEALEQGTATRQVDNIYIKIVERYGGEMNVLLNVSLEELSSFATERVVEGIKRVREEKVKIKCG